MIETIEEEEQNKLFEMEDTYQNTREEIKNKNMEELDIMKADLIKKIEDLDKDFEVNFNKYMNDTEAKSTKYRDLLSKNETSSELINKDQRKINLIKQQTAFLTLRIAQNKREGDERN